MTLIRKLIAWLKPHKKTIVVSIAAAIGTLIGLYASTLSPEVITSLVGIIALPFLFLDAKYGLLGQELMGLAGSALVGALVGALNGTPTSILGGIVAGTSLAALIKPIIQKVRSPQA